LKVLIQNSSSLAVFKRPSYIGESRGFIMPRRALDFRKGTEYLVIAVPKQMVPNCEAKLIEDKKEMIMELREV